MTKRDLLCIMAAIIHAPRANDAAANPVNAVIAAHDILAIVDKDPTAPEPDRLARSIETLTEQVVLLGRTIRNAS